MIGHDMVGGMTLIDLITSDQWLELRVFCMLLSSFPLETSLHFLTLRHIPTYFTTRLEVNGECIAPSETASSFLRRDKVDKKFAEVT